MSALQILVRLILRLDGLLCLAAGVSEPLGDVKLLGELKGRNTSSLKHPEPRMMPVIFCNYISECI